MEKKFIVTIGRQFGSGGSEIGYLLAQEFGVAYYDKDLITQAAKENGMSEHVVAQEDEKATGSFLYSLVLAPHAAASQFLNWSEDSLNERIYKAQVAYIKKVAEESSCVIIGRCADYVLWDQPNLFRVFLHADQNFRAKRIAKDGDIPLSKAEALIKKNDKVRANYYNFHTNRQWTAVDNYDLAINVGKSGIQNAVQQIKNFVEASLQNAEGKPAQPPTK